MQPSLGTNDPTIELSRLAQFDPSLRAVFCADPDRLSGMTSIETNLCRIAMSATDRTGGSPHRTLGLIVMALYDSNPTVARLALEKLMSISGVQAEIHLSLIKGELETARWHANAAARETIDELLRLTADRSIVSAA